MDSIDVRNAVYAKVAAYATRYGLRVGYENSSKGELESSNTPFTALEISYTDGEQADLSSNPMIKDTGSILITVFVRENRGTLEGMRLREDFARLLQRENFGGAVTQIAKKLPNTTFVEGWVGFRLSVPFWHYRLTK